MASKAGRWLAVLLGGGMLLTAGACPAEITSLVIRDALFFVLDTTFVQLTR